MCVLRLRDFLYVRAPHVRVLLALAQYRRRQQNARQPSQRDVVDGQAQRAPQAYCAHVPTLASRAAGSCMSAAGVCCGCVLRMCLADVCCGCVRMH